jgi:hypothetical protein
MRRIALHGLAAAPDDKEAHMQQQAGVVRQGKVSNPHNTQVGGDVNTI